MAKIAPTAIPLGDPQKADSPAGYSSGSNHEKERGSIVHAAVSEWRYFMHWSGWYDSSTSMSIRRFLRGKVFAITAMASLFVALFFSDIFVLCESEKNEALDVILMVVMLIFALEFCGLAATDPSYLFSFFFWMDLLGTLSMIFDISFILGSDAREPEITSGAGAEENVIVVRAARATKLGARAGRLSRVMKLLRFLPFVNTKTQESNVKMARVISNQLTNVLSTRVAFLIISVVVVLPIFGMFTYPELDDSMTTWAELLATNSQELLAECAKVPQNSTEIGLSRVRLDRELNAYANFYSDLSYGPFKACFGVTDSTHFMGAKSCQDKGCVAFIFNSSFKEPGRKNFIRIVGQNSFMTAFDLSTPKQLEAVANISLIVFIILIMCSFGLVTSNSITVIALFPLERMLSVVRQRCKQIFAYTDVLQDDDSDEESGEEYDDTDQSSEFALLEKVVGKLAAIAQLSSTKDEPEAKENMTEDEVMTLNWMQGTQVAVHKKRVSHLPPGDLPQGDTGEVAHPAVANSVLDNIPSDVLEALDGPDFCTIDLPKEHRSPVAAHIILTADGCCAWVRQNVQEVHIFKFVSECESKYKANPFHNFEHALDVAYSCARHMRLIQADRFLPDTSQYWLLVAAIGHDLGHLGVNNMYLIETSHELALKYNDRSPLENMHCATLFQDVLSNPQANVFAGADKDLYKEMRKGIINAILHTDVTKHQEMMKELVLLYQMNSEAFDAEKDGDGVCTPAVVEVLQNNLQFTLNAMLHVADVGNPMKPWEIARRLAYLCVDEFFAQGDQEKAAGIPVQMLNDRDKVNRPNSQIGFIEFVIAPMVEGMVRIFPTLDGLADNLGSNIVHWFEVWVDEVKATGEVKTKTEARVTKVHTRLQAVLRHDYHSGESVKVSLHQLE